VTCTIVWRGSAGLVLISGLCRVLQAASSALFRVVDSPIPTSAAPPFSKRVPMVTGLSWFGFERTSIMLFIIVAETCWLIGLVSSVGI